jgi:glycerophosphoryl diester phosphodiesterase
MAKALDYVTARPIAHRGLHDRTKGIVENTASAFRAAMAHGFAYECDVQLTADGEAVVFHDFTLERLTTGSGRVVDRKASEIAALSMRDGPDRVGTMADMLALTSGKSLIVCEIKSTYDGDMRLTNRVAEVARGYSGPLVIKSFDPAIVAHWHTLKTRIPVGIVAMNAYEYPDYVRLTASQKHALANLLHFSESRPDFVSWRIADLPCAAPYLCRAALGLPLMTWTVRTEAERASAARHADQIVFEGFVP